MVKEWTPEDEDLNDCENCGAKFHPQTPGYINGFDCDRLCSNCCDEAAEEQFAINELIRCGG